MVVFNIMLGMALANAIISIFEKEKIDKMHRTQKAIHWMMIAVLIKLLQ